MIDAGHQLRVAECPDRLRGQSVRPGQADHRGHRAGTYPHTPGRLPVAPLQRPFQPQDVSNLPHGQSFRGHRSCWERW